MPGLHSQFGLRLKLMLLTGLLCALPACNRNESNVTALKIPISASAPAVQPTESDWPGFRGGRHQGQSSSENLPVEWDLNKGIVWNVPVPPGRSSPIVYGDQVILSSEQESGTASQCELHCYDRTTGAVLWNTKLGTPSGTTHRRNGFAAATPACDGTHLFTSLPPLGIYCHDLQGNLLWQQPLGEVSQKWGFASSPITYEGMVIQLVDSEADSHLTAFAAATGEVVWRTTRESQGCWSTPVITNFGGADLLIVNGTGSADGSQGYVIAYDPHSGSELWRVRGTTDIPCPTPIVTDELLISSSGGNGPVFALRPGSSVPEIDRMVWRHAAGGPYVPTGIAYQGLLYLVGDGGMLACYRVADGERLYRKRLQGTFSASLLAGDGKIYITSERGDVYVIGAGEEYALLSTNRMQGHCLATPAIAYDQIFLRTETDLYCIAGQPPEIEPEVQPPPRKALPSPSDTLPQEAPETASAEANEAA